MDLQFKHLSYNFKAILLNSPLLLCHVLLMLWSLEVLLISFGAFLPQQVSGSKVWIYFRNWYYLSEDIRWIICSFALLLLSQYQSNHSPLCTAWEQLVKKIQTHWRLRTIKTPINFTDVIYMLFSRSGGAKEIAHKNSLLQACDGQHPPITALGI